MDLVDGDDVVVDFLRRSDGALATMGSLYLQLGDGLRRNSVHRDQHDQLCLDSLVPQGMTQHHSTCCHVNFGPSTLSEAGVPGR